MPEQKLPNHEEIENVFKPVETILQKLPDCIETRSAKRNLDVAADYIHQAIEKVERER
jgi:hypothetical protein